MTSITADKSFNQDNCAYCNHRCIIPVGLDINEITLFNNKVEKFYLEKMKIYNNIPSKKEGLNSVLLSPSRSIQLVYDAR